MFPYEADPTVYWFMFTCTVCAIITLVIWVSDRISANTSVGLSLAFTLSLMATLVLIGVIYTGSTYSTEITVCNDLVLINNGYYIQDENQKVYYADDPEVVINLHKGKNATIYVVEQLWSKPTIYKAESVFICNVEGC